MMLAKAGVSVKVLEKADRVGGRTSTIQADGFKFDLGPTFFLYPQVLSSIFQMCGMRLEDEVELIKLDPHYRLVYEDQASFPKALTAALVDLRLLPERLRRLDAV